MVPSGGISVCGNGNMPGAFDDFDRIFSSEPRNGGKRLVGPRAAEDGDLH